MRTYKPFTPISYATCEADNVNLTAHGVEFYAIMHHDKDTNTNTGDKIKAHSHLAIDPQKSIDPAAIATKEFDPLNPQKPRTWVFGKHRDPKEVIQNNPAWLAHWVGYVTHYPPYLEKFPPKNEAEGREVYDYHDIKTNDPDRIQEAWEEMLEIVNSKPEPLEDDPADCALRDKMIDAVQDGKSFGEVVKAFKIGAHSLPLLHKTYDLLVQEFTETGEIKPTEAARYRLEYLRMKEECERLQKVVNDLQAELRLYHEMRDNPTTAPYLQALEKGFYNTRKPTKEETEGLQPCNDELPF